MDAEVEAARIISTRLVESGSIFERDYTLYTVLAKIRAPDGSAIPANAPVDGECVGDGPKIVASAAKSAEKRFSEF